MKKDLNDNSYDYLTALLNIAPANWALIRANEIRALDKIKFSHPVLDIGCGNGVVAGVILKKRNEKFDMGIDLSEKEVSFAKKSGFYKKCKVESVYKLSFKNGEFACVFSNSVVEHIPDLEQALSEMSRVLKKNGQFIITVPTPYLTKYLWGYSFFKNAGFKILADAYGKFFNFLFKHHNLYTDKQWEKILKKHSLELTAHYYYHTRRMVQVHEFLTYAALPYFISKLFFGYWVVFPKLRRVLISPWLSKRLRSYYLDDVRKDEGGSVLLVARKI